MKVALLVCSLASTALAAPKHQRASKLDPTLSDHVKAAELAWTAAEQEQSAILQPEAWETAAKAFAAVDGDALDAKVKTEAARAAVLAWENEVEGEAVKLRSGKLDTSITTPQPLPLPPREQAMVEAFDRYQRYVTDPADPDLPRVLFLEATVYSRFDHLDDATKLYRVILDHHRKHEVAEYSANLLLDAYNRLGRYDELIALADELAKDKAFLAGRDDLRDLVRKIVRQGARKKAEGLEHAAMDSHDSDKFVAAGNAYLAIYNADPENRENDEVLYNAGVALEEGHAVSGAAHTFALLAKSYPNSRITARAIARLGKLYGDIAMYDKAAERLEEYVKKYSGEKDAYDALSDAIYYRKALGDRDKVIADVDLFEKLYGARRPSEAAAAMWSLTSLYDSDPTRLVAHLRQYIRTFGNKGGGERIVIAYAKIGEALWKQSCPVAGFDGLCVKSAEQPRACGKGTARTYVVVPRNAAKAKEALAAMASAIREFERSHTEDVSARYSYARAKLATADAALEPYLALTFPTLDFGDGSPQWRQKAQASTKRFNEWLEAKKNGGSNATRQYDEVLALKDVAGAITAAERHGIITESFASALVGGPVPADVKAEPHAKEKIDAYCDALSTAAEPLEEQTINAFTTCLAKSTELSWFDDSSRICEHELARMKPDEFPAAKERRTQAINASPVIALEPALAY